MIKPRVWILLFLVLSEAFASNGNNSPNDSHKDQTQNDQVVGEGMVEGQIHSSSKNIKVPESLIRKIEEFYLKNYRKENPESVDSDVQVIMQIPRRRISVDMIWSEDRRNALLADYYFRLPRGGARVDFSEHLTGNRGSFEVKIIPQWEHPEGEGAVQAFYVSDAKKRRIDSDSFGAGCTSFFDLTSWFASGSHEKGFLVNSTEGRHIVLSGIYVFVGYHDGALFLSVLSLVDSRWPQWHCGHQENLS